MTKVGPGRDLAHGRLGRLGHAPSELRDHVEHNLATLGLDRLHVVNYRSNGRDDVPAAVAALAALRDEGLLDTSACPTSGPTPWRPPRQVTDIVCVQNRHAAGYERVRRRTTCSPPVGEHGIAFVPFFTIAGQAREGAAEEPYDVVQAIADAHGATPAQVRIAWTLALGAARAGHPRHRRPRPPRAERRGRLAPAHRRRPDAALAALA